MGTLTYPYSLTAGQAENVNHLNSNLTAISNVLNGSVDADNLAAGAVTGVKLASVVEAATGVNGASTRRGKCIIATEESTTSASYTTLTTPDRVQNIVLPTDGLLFVGYRALWKESSSGAARAALFLGANQLQTGDNSAAVVQESQSGGGSTGVYYALHTNNGGLISQDSSGVADTVDVTTGQVLGSASSSGYGAIAVIFAAAGTYTVSVQFKTSAGTVTAKSRKLWVWSMGFD